MAKEIDKIIQSKTAPKSNNVLWDDGENLKISRNGKWESAGGSAPMINITYTNLVELRNNNKLISGMQYRITDYVTTTAQENTRSAGHQFDIIVTADNENTLNEVARACLHEGDTYFSEAGAKLEAWQIWYSLDNDAERFAWASNKEAISNVDSIFYRNPSLDTTNNGVLYYAWRNEYEEVTVYTIKENPTEGELIYDDTFAEDWEIIKVITKGKGVIYRMIDEWNNDCPYDFKNIQFKRNLTFENGYAEYSDDGAEIWVYTFAGQSYHINNDEWSNMLDGSLESPFGHISDEKTYTFHNNTIQPYIMVYNGNDVYAECGLRYLNDIVFLGYWQKIGSANEEDMPYYYAYCCFSNSFGNDCKNNSFGNNCHSNSFGNDFYDNSFGRNCMHNNFGNSCGGNNFGNSCTNNSFGNNCTENSFGNNCTENSFGNGCSYNNFSNGCFNVELNEETHFQTAYVNSKVSVKVFNLADLADLLN